MREMLLEEAPHVLLWPDFMSSFYFPIYLNRDLEKQRESSASNIAKKKQEAEAAVSILQAYMQL